MGELTGLARYDIVFSIEENEYRGTITPQLRIADFRRVESPRIADDGGASRSTNNGNGAVPHPTTLNGAVPPSA
jgi:hypothetical protein